MWPIVITCFATAVYMVLVRRLYLQFGWEEFRILNASFGMKRAYEVCAPTQLPCVSTDDRHVPHIRVYGVPAQAACLLRERILHGGEWQIPETSLV